MIVRGVAHELLKVMHAGRVVRVTEGTPNQVVWGHVLVEIFLNLVSQK